MSNGPRIVVALSILALVYDVAGAEVVQVPLPFNADLVRETGGVVSGGGFDLPHLNPPVPPSEIPTFDPGGRAFVTQSEAAANDPLDPRGLPDSGVLQVPGGTVQLGPYNGNNSLRFGTFGTNYSAVGVFIPVENGQYASMQIYGAGAFVVQGASVPLSVFQQTDSGLGYTPTSLNWKPGRDDTTPVLIGGLDTTGPNGAGFEDVDLAAIQCRTYLIPATPAGSALHGFIIRGLPDAASAGASVAVFAVTLTTVPEPTSLGLAAGVLACVVLSRRRYAAARRRS